MTLIEIINILKSGNSYLIPNSEIHHIIAYFNEFEPTVILVVEINYKPNQTKIKIKYHI